MSLTLARRWYLGAGVAVLIAYVVTPAAGRMIPATVMDLLAVGAIWYGIRRLRPERRHAWLLIATSVALLAIGDAAVAGLTLAGEIGSRGYPHVPDLIYLVMYPPMAMGLLLLGRPRMPSRDWPLILDILAVGTAGSLVVWILIVVPAMKHVALTDLGRAVAVASWVGYIVVFATAVRVTLDWRRNPSLRAMTIGVLAFLATDFAYSRRLVQGQWSSDSINDIGYLAFSLLAGLAALLPSMRELTSDSAGGHRLGPRRLAGLAIALLVAPTALLIQAGTGSVWTAVAIAVVSAAVGIIMLIRLALTANAYRARAAREHAVRLATRSLVEATTKGEVSAGLHEALLKMLPDRSRASVLIRQSTVDRITLLPHAERAGTADLVIPTTGASDRHGEAHEIVFTGPVRHLIELRSSLAALADQASAALDRIDLIRRLRSEEREHYFRTLVLTSNEATLISRDGRIDYATPAARNMFGRDVHGQLFGEIVRRVSGDGAWRENEEAVDGEITRPDGSDVTVLVYRRDLRRDPSVNGVVSTLRDVTQERQMQRDLSYRATHDPLTGLANAQQFADELRSEARVVERRSGIGTGRAAIFIDLDDFKDVNDAYGHQVGDLLLVEVANRIRGCLRENDLAARLGGDEFAALLRNVPDEDAARSVAQRIVDVLAKPIVVGGIALHGQASVGLATTAQRRDLGELLRDADTALYNAKARGKGRWQEFQEGMANPVRHNVDIRRQIEEAIDGDRVDVHYQPIVELASGRAIGFEALVRLDDGNRPMSPAEFVAAAEETGLITRIGNLVLNRALSDWAALNAPSSVSRHVSVNVSARQVRDPDFVGSVRDALERHRVDPSQLILEVTETILVARDDRAWLHLSHLRDDGVRIAIDDFGTGYASMSYLRQTALDVLKVDQSFLDGVAMGRTEVLLRSITGLARELGLQTIAEGVRDQPARDLLLRVGCEYGQGFLYAPALPVDRAASWYGPAP